MRQEALPLVDLKGLGPEAMEPFMKGGCRSHLSVEEHMGPHRATPNP